MTAFSFVVSIAAGFAVSELAGYWLHVLMHSERLPYLSRNHMIHHLKVYPPNGPQRPSAEYILSTFGRANVLGLGAEWILPILLILGALATGLRLLGVPAAEGSVVVAAALGWGALMFWYMHDAMHLKGFWMERNGFLGRWFRSARLCHDIHHMDLGGDGRMTLNYGICFFFFDRLFGSFSDHHQHFNRPGLDAAMRRYGPMLGAR